MSHPAFRLVALAAAVAAAWLWLTWPDRGWDAPAVHAPAPADTAQIARGEYLVRAGDCMACHTAQGQPPYAGGRAIPTPFGEIYSSNLTPDAETGLGNWSAEDFWRALHFGRSRDGHRLYPAFPYTSYTLVTHEDADAMHAYLRTLPAVSQPRRASTLRFPYDTRAALMVWRALYFRPREFTADARQSQAWNRGAYLVEGLGHCSACHTTRNWLGGSQKSRGYAGGPIPMLGWDALPLTAPESMSDQQAAEMAQLLQSGTTKNAVATGPMAEVVFHSLQYLSRADITAMVDYIRSLPYREPAHPDVVPVPEKQQAGLMEQGGKIYREHCADCHGDDGRGRPYVYPPLAGNRLVTAPSPTNAIETILFGGYGASTAAMPEPYGMPPYGHQLPAASVAAVLTYIRASWGNTASPVSPTDVERH